MFARLGSMALAVGIGIGLSGCTHEPLGSHLGNNRSVATRKVATQIEYPAICPIDNSAVEQSLPPRTLASGHTADAEYWQLSLEDAIRIGLENSRVFRDLGGRLLSTAQAAGTTFDPSIIESDPITGVEAALSNFDAVFTAQGGWARNERPVNFTFQGLIPPNTEQDLFNGFMELRKTNPTGGTAFIRHNINYEWGNNPNLRFPSVWTPNIEAEIRQPLLQGAGLEVNRILGPNATAGFTIGNGVVIARINNDIALADFEVGVRNLVSDIENAYWDLYFAYRDLDAQVAGRDSALATWRRIKSFEEVGVPGGEADQEAQARSQYYLFVGLVEDALSGRRVGSTTTGGRAGAGQFSGSGGLYARESDLRLLMGLPLNDGRLIRPDDEPTFAQVSMDWSKCLAEALTRRVDLRRQRWVVKQRELRLSASQNFLLPQLDGQALYRWHGFGDDYIDPRRGERFSSAWQTITSGEFQEWQLGLLFSVPLGQRQAYSGVRNAELQLARERAILHDQELSVAADLGSAFRELERSYARVLTDFNRRLASQREVEAVEARYLAGESATTLDVLLDAQRRQADAERDFFRSRVEYALAIKSLHFEKGTLLEYNTVRLAEGPWHPQAYKDAAALKSRLAKPLIDYGLHHNPSPLASPVPFGSYAGALRPTVDGEQRVGGRPSPVEPEDAVRTGPIDDSDVPPDPRFDLDEPADRTSLRFQPHEGRPAQDRSPRQPEMIDFSGPELNAPEFPFEFDPDLKPSALPEPPASDESEPAMRIRLGSWQPAAGGVRTVSHVQPNPLKDRQPLQAATNEVTLAIGPGFIKRNMQEAAPQPQRTVYYVPVPVPQPAPPTESKASPPNHPVVQATPAADTPPLRRVPARTTASSHRSLTPPAVANRAESPTPRTLASPAVATPRALADDEVPDFLALDQAFREGNDEPLAVRPLPSDMEVELMPAPTDQTQQPAIRLTLRP